MMNIEALPRSDVPRQSRWHGILNRVNKVFWFTVALPTLLAIVYYAGLARDVYVSESRFVVRSPQRAASSGLGQLLAGTGIARGHDDSYTVTSYVVSRSALMELDRQVGLRKVYGGYGVDVFDRFPGLSGDDSIEALYAYYQRHVDVDYDPVASIATMQIRSHDAGVARDINERLLQMSERLVNNLNDRSRHDLIDVARREVDEAEAHARRASADLSAFRSKGQVYDPDHESAASLDTVNRLREELRVTEVQIQRLKALSPSNPQLPSLLEQARATRDAIAAEGARVTGVQGSLAAKSSAFDRLMLEKTLAEKELAGAVESLQSARDDASRKQLYLERLVEPNLPDYPLEPRRWRGVITVFVIGMIAWGVVSLLVAGIREHTD
jgi:capsular polysaccharide transport system permease protein